MAKGLDTATPCSQATIDAIAQAGYTFLARYYCTGALSKKLTPSEARRISSAGVWVVSVFQDYSNEIRHFSASSGTANGNSAYDYADRIIGQPARTPIYFAADFDAVDAELKGGIKDYFTAVRAAFAAKGGRYRIGVYGSGAVCKYIKDALGLAEFSWLSMSTGWRGHESYRKSNLWNLRQLAITKIDGVEFDTNESSASGGGGWKILGPHSAQWEQVETNEDDLGGQKGERW